MSESNIPDPEIYSRKPQDNVFTQQRLRTFSPVPSPNSIIVTLGFFAVFFLIIGGVIKAANSEAISFSLRYDNLDSCPRHSNCTINIPITEKMNGPIYFYYVLTNFYQNYRRYVKSQKDTQLRGESIYKNLGSCDPLIKYNRTDLYPCGLIASSMFNDTFSEPTIFTSSNNNTVSLKPFWDETGIAFPVDKQKKFRPPPAGTVIKEGSLYGPNGRLPNVTDEHFIVWMRVAGLPQFRKLYARVYGFNLQKGDIFSLTIANNFPGSEKHIFLSTTSSLGVRNKFIEVTYFIVGAVCAVVGIMFFIKHKFISSRALGVVKYAQFTLPKPTSSSSVEMKTMADRRPEYTASPPSE